MNYKRFIFVLIVTFLSTLEIFAGGRNRVGTAGAQELLIPIGARGTALGGSYISSISGIDALFWDPAGISGTTQNAEAMFSHMTYIADIGISAVGVTGNIAGFGSIGLSIRSVSFGDIPVTTETNSDPGWETYSPSYVVVGLTYAKSLSDRVRIGVTTNLISESIVRSKASGIAFDAGIQYFGLGGINGLKVGITLKNLGPQMKYSGGDLVRYGTSTGALRSTMPLEVEAAGFELPSYFELGVGYEAMVQSDHKFTLGTSFQNNNYLDDEYKFSLEYSFKDLFYVRGSYQFAPQAPTDDYLFGPAFGAGIHYATSGVDLTLDYAYRYNKLFDASNVVTLKVGF